MIVFIAAVAAARCRKTVVAPVYIFHIQRLAINNSQVVTNMFTQLGHYVKAAADGDLAKFNTSGFVATSTVHTAPQPLPPASFDWIDRGPVSGQVVVKPKRLPKAVNYDVRYASLGTGGTPGTWVTVTLPSAKKAAIQNLTPGATYAFQVRAYGKLGHTDWSDSMTFIPA